MRTYIIVFFSLCLLSVFSLPQNTKICQGKLCDLSCNNCNSFCTTENCKIENNCHCPSTEIPGSIALADTPMFVFFNVDDSITKDFIDKIGYYTHIFNGISDSRGCNIEPTMYTTTDGTYYDYINQFAQTGEIALHTCTHKTSDNTDTATWKLELEQNEEYLSKYSKIVKICIILAEKQHLRFKSSLPSDQRCLPRPIEKYEETV